MELTVINPPATLWDAKSDTVHPALLVYGYDVYAETGDLLNKSKWIYVILNNNNSQTIDIPVGYEYSHTVKANIGFSDVGATIDWVNGDAGLQALAIAYSIPSPATWDELASIDLGIIPKVDLTFTLDGNVIKNWAAIKG